MAFAMFAPAMAFEAMDSHDDDQDSIQSEVINLSEPSFPSAEKEVDVPQNETDFPLYDPDDEPLIHGLWLVFGWVFFVFGELIHRFLCSRVTDEWTKEMLNRTENLTGYLVMMGFLLVGTIANYFASNARNKQMMRQISAHYLAEDAE